MTFSLLLTVAAVLPVALGLGAIRLKASAVPAQTVTEVEQNHSADESAVDVCVVDRSIADRDFLERRYEVALRRYRSLGSPQRDRLPAELQYRIALCQEALGLWDEALVGLRSVSECTTAPALRAASSIGQARIWFRLNNAAQAELLLRALELHAETARPIPKEILLDTAFLLPLAMAQQSVVHAENGPRFPVSQLITWSLETALKWADESPMPDVTEAAPTNQAELNQTIHCRLNGNSSASDRQFHLDEWTIDLNCRDQSVKHVVQAIAETCGWTVDWTDLKDNQLLAQRVSISAAKRPVWSLLTLLCSELTGTWFLDDQRLILQRADQGISTRRMVARTLTSLAVWNPNYRLVNPARYALGEIAQSQGDLQQAAEQFAALVGRDSSNLSVRAAYNAAYNYFRLGDYSRACYQLRYVVDAAPEQSLHAEALIMLGRLLLDQGEVQDAIFQLRRATDSRCLPDQQARAAVLLGLAYLIQEKYADAAEAVFAHKLQLDEPGVRYAAAFITAYSRWHVVTGEMKERETTFLYRSLVAVKNDFDWLGQSGQLLIGRAYLELGFDDLMYDHYSHMLTNGVTQHIEAEMTYWLAGYELSNGNHEVAFQLFHKLADGPVSRWKNRAKLKLAEVALADGRPGDGLDLCEQIQAGDGVTRDEVLKMMGRAYEQMGQDQQAARCYAGQPPAR